MIIQFRGTSRNIYGLKVILFNIVKNLLNCFHIHRFVAPGACVQMAMTARLITEKAHIDLEGLRLYDAYVFDAKVRNNGGMAVVW